MMKANEAQSTHKARGKPIKRAILWGFISLAAYLLVFFNQDEVTVQFTKGGILSVIFVVGTVIAFAFIHGAFANYILEVLGIEALEKEKKEDN